MKKYIIITLLLTIALTGCTSKEIEALNNKYEELLNENNKIKQELIEKSNENVKLESIIAQNKIEIETLKESIWMIRYSSEARLDDFNDSFNLLDRTYKFHTPYIVRDDWYVISDENFKLELLGYEDALKVEICMFRMSSDEEIKTLYVDNDSSDGWIYENNKISEYINKQIRGPKNSISYEPTFVIYAKVYYENGSVVQTSKLPIYYL